MQPEQNTDRGARKLTRRAEHMLRPDGSVLESILQSRAQRERKANLVERVRQRAMEVKRQEASKAAEICSLQDQFDQQDAHQLMVLEHRQQMNDIELGAKRKAFTSMQQILESKAAWLNSLQRNGGDADLLEQALQKIEDLHDDAAQSILDRNYDAGNQPR